KKINSYNLGELDANSCQIFRYFNLKDNTCNSNNKDIVADKGYHDNESKQMLGADGKIAREPCLNCSTVDQKATLRAVCANNNNNNYNNNNNNNKNAHHKYTDEALNCVNNNHNNNNNNNKNNDAFFIDSSRLAINYNHELGKGAYGKVYAGKLTMV